MRLPAERVPCFGRVGPRVAEIAGARRQVRLLERLSQRRAIVSASSLTVVGLPAEMLRMRPLTPSASAARRLAATTLSTYVKSRDCSPSSKIVAGRPAAIAVMKSGTTAAYCDVGSCRGPKTLK